MGKNNFLYSLSYNGEKTEAFSQEIAIDFLMHNFSIKKSEAIDFLKNEFSVCQHTPYNDVLKVHKEFYNAGMVLKLTKELKPKKNIRSKKTKKQTDKSSGIVTRECISR